MTTTLDMMSSMEQTIAALTAENAKLLARIAELEDIVGASLAADPGRWPSTLRAENARLRGELAAVQPELEAMQARAVALDTVVSEHSALTAALAAYSRVVALLESAEAHDEDCRGMGPHSHSVGTAELRRALEG